MRVVIRGSFTRDIKKIRDAKLQARVRECVESARIVASIGEIANILPMTDHENYFRVRIADHRIGLYLEGDTVEFIRFSTRRDFYRSFP